MRYLINLLSVASIALFLAASVQAETITPHDVIQYVDGAVTVEGVVSQVSTSNRGTTFINFGGRYPNQIFYAVIFPKHQGKFSGIRGLQGKAVAISGTVTLYKGRPQIILLSPNQIELR